MSRKNTKAKKLRRNKRVRRARRAEKSKFKWVIPSFVFIGLAAVIYYRVALMHKYTATEILYDKVDKADITTERCILSSSNGAAKAKVEFMRNLLSKQTIEVKEVSVVEGCSRTFNHI